MSEAVECDCACCVIAWAGLEAEDDGDMTLEEIADGMKARRSH